MNSSVGVVLTLFALFLKSALIGQSTSLSFVLASKQENIVAIVTDAHAFLENTTFGTLSDEQGNIFLDIPTSIQADMIISHVGHATKILTAETYLSLEKGDTVWLASNNLDLTEIVVQAKRTSKWKRNYKKFKKFFLGADGNAKKCTILNPEVLRFEEENGNFNVHAIDLITIQNQYLGYEVNYLLTQFSVKANGSSTYSGQAVFKDLSTEKNRDQFAKNRQEAYQNSSKYFFFSLISNQLQANGFEIGFSKLEPDGFVDIVSNQTDEIVLPGPSPSVYQVQFPAFLKVINKNNKELTTSKLGVRSGGLESQRFSNSSAETKTRIEYATSYLYKISPFVEVNKFGNVLNTKMVKEYGFWANRRFAYQLPFDYGNDYSRAKPIVVNKEISKKAAERKEKGISDNQKLKLFTTLIYEKNASLKTMLLAQIEKIWEPAFVPVLIEYLRLSPDQTFVQEVVTLLAQKTGQNFGTDHLSWAEWLWKEAPIYGNYYADFKGAYYQLIDPKFMTYFHQRQSNAQVRLDEIVWGGVRQDGIPPLRNPTLIDAESADYLADDNVVFGVYLNGVAKAYPKRILAWHEFFTDTFGDAKVAGVYCTLCGTVIAYDMEFNGAFHDLGTSGFLYRSNKLMYDKKTQSLWSTIEGKPVVGPLVDQNIFLKTYSVVTTTWGAWKQQFPDTQVLSLETGHDRDYSEGAAYADYFGTDNLMFPVPKMDNRLPNKAEVFIVRPEGYKKNPLAISVSYLKKKKWHTDKIGNTEFVVVADKTGAAWAFPANGISFVNYKKGKIKDSENRSWQLVNGTLQSTDNQTLKPLSSHSIFWFAWYNAYPNTRLVK